MNKDLRVENMGHHRNKNSGGQFWNEEEEEEDNNPCTQAHKSFSVFFWRLEC